MTDKLAEEIARKQISLYLKGRKDNPTNELYDRFIKAMQAYHEAKMKEVTDEDIKKWIFSDTPVKDGDEEWLYGFRQGKLTGAKAMRDGEIKHNREV